MFVLLVVARATCTPGMLPDLTCCGIRSASRRCVPPQDVGLSWGQVTTLLSNACDAAFIDEAARAELKTCVLTGANSVLASEGLLVEPAA